MRNVLEILEEVHNVIAWRIGKDYPEETVAALGLVLHFLVDLMVCMERGGKEDLKKRENEVIEIVTLMIRGGVPALEQLQKGKKK